MTRKHSHYFKDVSGVETIDVYAVCKLFEVNDAALSHALKKIIAAGGRGVKSQYKDVAEARDTLERWLELHNKEELEARAKADTTERGVIAIRDPDGDPDPFKDWTQ